MESNWTIEQITIALYEYCRKPFGQFSSTKPFVVELANLLGRTPGAIVRKVGNLASLDPEKTIKGLSNRSKLDKVVWDKYYGKWDQLVYDAETLIAQFKEKKFEDSISIDLTDLPEGKERLTEVKRRLNQDFFRNTVLSSYNQKCCITGLNNPSLLHACHISDWSTDEANRTNPENGLCMNVLFHKAYDELLMGIDPDYKIHFSEGFFGDKINEVDDKTIDYINQLEGKSIILPGRFLPSKELLEEHFDKYLHHTA